MSVTILQVQNGDVEISAPKCLTFVNVETLLSVGNSAAAIIAAPAPAAHGRDARSHVLEAGCWKSVSLVRTGYVTPAMTQAPIWIITNPASRVLAKKHACQ